MATTASSTMACKGRVIWSREAETTLIEAVREHPVLWDPAHTQYKCKGLRRSLFTAVADTLKSFYPQLGTFTAGKLEIYVSLCCYHIHSLSKKATLPQGLGYAGKEGFLGVTLQIL